MRRDCRRCRVEQSGQQNAESDPQFGCLASSVPVCSRCSSQEQFQLLLQTGLPKNSKGQMASTSKRARFGPRIPPPQIPRNTGAYFDGSHLLPSPKLYSTSVPMLCVAWPMVSLREAPSGAKLQICVLVCPGKDDDICLGGACHIGYPCLICRNC